MQNTLSHPSSFQKELAAVKTPEGDSRVWLNSNTFSEHAVKDHLCPWRARTHEGEPGILQEKFPL